MAVFRFKLEPLLRHRRSIEERFQREMAQLLRERMILQTHLRRMQQTISDSRRDLSDGLVGAVDLDRVGQFARYSGEVRQQAQSMVVRLAALEKAVAQARQKLARATRARKALELLRDRRHEQFKRRLQRIEDAQLDEIAVQRYARRAMGVTP